MPTRSPIAALALLVAFAAPALAALDPEAFAKPDIQYADAGESLADNPARGAAPGWWHKLRRSGNEAGDPKGNCSWLWEIGEFSGGNEYKGAERPLSEIGGEDMPLTEDAIAAISNTLVNARANGATMIVRFGYTSGDVKGAEPSRFETIMGHIGQIAPVLGAFPDVVLAVEAGMTGPWGEMHSNNYREPEHVRAMTDAWLAGLGRRTALLVRYPKWILDYADKDVDDFLRTVADGTYGTQSAQQRLGMFNDGYLGTESDYGTWRSSERWMVRDEGVAYLEARRNVPYGGELAHISEEEAEAVGLFDLSRFNIVREFYRTHLSYLRNIDTKRHNLANRIGRLALTHDYDFEGMPDLSEWYGSDLRSFMREHMGYRFVVRDARVQKTMTRGKKSVAVLDVENTGFGKLLLDSRVEIILVNDEATVVAAAHMPRTSFSAIEGGARCRIPVEFTVPSELKRSGTYDLYVRLSAPTKGEKAGEVPRRPIRLANKAMWNEELKANSFGKTEVH